MEENPRHVSGISRRDLLRMHSLGVIALGLGLETT